LVLDEEGSKTTNTRMGDSCGLQTSVKLFDFGLCCRRMGCDKLEVYLYLTSRRETEGERE
jgi:hypothetical protein